MKYTANVTCHRIKPILLLIMPVVLQPTKDVGPAVIETVVVTAEEETATTVAVVVAITEAVEAGARARADQTAAAVRADREKNVKENYGSRIMVGGKGAALNY